MTLTTRGRNGLLACCLGGAFVIIPASACSQGAETTGRTHSALVTPTPQNFQLSGVYENRHELTTVFLNGPWGPPQGLGHGRWLVAWNASNQPVHIGVGWSYSNDAMGDLWVYPQELLAPLDWGDPGPSPYNGGAFDGYLGDVALAPITHPEFSNGGRRAILVNIAANAPSFRDDVVAVLADFDSADNIVWTHPSYVTTSATGGRADIPHVASNPVSPYHTFASWEDVAVGSSTSWLRRIGYDAGSTFCGSGTCAAATQIPSGPGTTSRKRPNIALGRTPQPCLSGGEAVFVISVDDQRPRCNGTQLQYAVKWYMSMYDVVGNTWYGPWLLYDEPALPTCVGIQGQTDNSDDGHIAGDPYTPWFWTTHTIGRPCGATGCPPSTTRTSDVHAEYGFFFCAPGQPPPGCLPYQPCPQISHWTPPTGSNPGTIASWVPAIGASNTGVHGQRTAIYWYSTRDDPGNSLAAVYMSYEEQYGQFSWPQQISFPTGTSDVIPWVNSLAKYDDYQHLGVNHVYGSFLAAWADRRDSKLTYSELWSDLLQ